MSLAQKNIVVIGGTSGIGLAAAVQASEAGASVWAASRSAEKIEAAQAQEAKDKVNMLEGSIRDLQQLYHTTKGDKDYYQREHAI